MTDDQSKRLAEFLEPSRIVMVATIGSDGVPQVTPNWFYYDGDRLAISTTKDRVKYRNLSRDPRMTVCIAEEPMARDYVTISGPVSISDDDSIWPPTRSIIGRYLPADRVDQMIEKMKSEGRVILWLTPEKVVFRS
jgi:PPOX class probable F420-dependent enzyme